MSDDGSNQQCGLENWYDIKWKDIKTRKNREMWLWNRITNSYWLEVLAVIGIILVLLSGGPEK
jgi:hypothetical protein